jgi:hypothetical protein
MPDLHNIRSENPLCFIPCREQLQQLFPLELLITYAISDWLIRDREACLRRLEGDLGREIAALTQVNRDADEC